MEDVLVCVLSEELPSTFKFVFRKATILSITAKSSTTDVKTLNIILVQS